MSHFFLKLRKLLRLTTRAPDDGNNKNNTLKEQQKTNINILNSQKNTPLMSMFNYGVGGNEVKVDANEAIQEIQENKTLLVSKLTENDPISPEIITGLKTVEDVFRYFQPVLSVEHETTDGQLIKEDLRFNNVGDFTPKSITQQSKYMNDLSIQQEQYNKIIRQLKSNKVLRNMLENAESKEAFISALKAVAQELESNKDL